MTTPLIDFDTALNRVLQAVRPTPQVEEVPLEGAYGRFLAQDANARENIPIADNSAMDGFAVRYEDVAPKEGQGGVEGGLPCLRVVEVLGARSVAGRPLVAGEAMKIMTGAPIPPGADTVVMVEHTRSQPGPDGAPQVVITLPPRPGEHIRPAGGDYLAGQPALHRGDLLGPAQVGILASLGYPRVKVVRRPLVGVLATGDELAEPGEPLTPGRVRNANSYTLTGLIHQAGAEPRNLGMAPDNRESLRHILARGLAQHDVLITSGGVSMGDYDFVKPLADELGLEVGFKALNVRPGKPVVFASREGKLFFGLPGNPVSAMVAFLQLVRPALLKMMGHPHLGLRRLRVPLEDGFSKKDGKRHFLRGVVYLTAEPSPLGGPPSGSLGVRLTGHQGSGLLHSMERANCLVIIPEESRQIPPGHPVEVQLFEGPPLALEPSG
ncbi:MAG: molybdopterin molybdotransferase MoeA [Deltaproteobacteria bacterium]|nr:molybdopterin molybdotransferase MoeA [Deltaproteobacteria bacterium]